MGLWDSPTKILESIDNGTSDPAWGFVLYRCTSADISEEQWNRFMDRLNLYTKASLKLKPEDQGEIWEKFDWNVQAGPDLVGASVEDVRRRHQIWVQSVLGEGCGPGAGPRYEFCLLVDDASLKSILAAPELKDKISEILKPTAYVVGVGTWFKDEEVEEEAVEEDEDPTAAIYEDEEEYKGLMWISLIQVTRLYQLLLDGMWVMHDITVTPPKIWNDNLDQF